MKPKAIHLPKSGFVYAGQWDYSLCDMTYTDRLSMDRFGSQAVTCKRCRSRTWGEKEAPRR